MLLEKPTMRSARVRIFLNERTASGFREKSRLRGNAKDTMTQFPRPISPVWTSATYAALPADFASCGDLQGLTATPARAATDSMFHLAFSLTEFDVDIAAKRLF